MNTPDKTPRRKRATQNPLAFVGLLIAGGAFAAGIALLVAQLTVATQNPYSAIITFIVVPAVMGLGGTLAVAGVVWERRRLKRHQPSHAYPVVDFNTKRARRRALLITMCAAIFLTVSAVAMYRGYVYTESTEFCGTTCHNVMGAEYAAYQQSPHSRVSCAACHIGEGADWYVRSKISGMRQVLRTIDGSYEQPIPTPIEDLRPARETCEHCHWPTMFHGSHEREWYSVWSEENTLSRYRMLMLTGGLNPATGEFEGIHKHTSADETVRYWPADEQRLEIPWVEVTTSDGTVTEYRSDGAPEGRPPADEIRTMDCIDCHNRPSHQYRPPALVINEALVGGRISLDLPLIKATSVGLVDAPYETTDEARQAIEEGMRAAYADSEVGPDTIEQAIAELVSIYEQTTFPEYSINWRTYPDHIGHTYSPGCFRCHGGEHAAEGGEVISHECSNCHSFVSQAHGPDALGEVVYEAGPWQHPDGIEDMHEGFECTYCHGPEEDEFE